MPRTSWKYTKIIKHAWANCIQLIQQNYTWMHRIYILSRADNVSIAIRRYNSNLKCYISHRFFSKNIYICLLLSPAIFIRYHRISIIDRFWKCQLLNPFLSFTISTIKLKYFIADLCPMLGKMYSRTTILDMRL